MRLLRHAIAILYLVVATVGVAQTPATPVPAPVVATPVPAPNPSTQQNPKPVLTSEEDLRAAWIALLQKLAQQKSDSSSGFGPAFAALIGGLISAAVTWITLYFNGRREKERLEQERAENEADRSATASQQADAARVEAQLNYASKFLDHRIKQLELFFAPLHAHLQQSAGVYQKLKLQLLQDPVHYREVPATQPESPPTFEICVPNSQTWADFRLLDRMPALKGDLQAGPLIKEIIRIGEAMTKIIAEHGAYAASENIPSEVFGRYLAHFAILKSIYEDPRTDAFRPGEHAYGYYPRELNNEVKKGYEAALERLKKYEQASDAVLAEVLKRAENPSLKSKP